MIPTRTELAESLDASEKRLDLAIKQEIEANDAYRAADAALVIAINEAQRTSVDENEVDAITEPYRRAVDTTPRFFTASCSSPERTSPMQALQHLDLRELERRHEKKLGELRLRRSSFNLVVRTGNDEAVRTMEKAIIEATVACVEIELAIACRRIREVVDVAALAEDRGEPGGHDSPEATRHLDNVDGLPGYWKKFVGDSIDAANYDDEDSYSITNADGDPVRVLVQQAGG